MARRADIQIKSHWEKIDAELNRLENILYPGSPMLVALNSILSQMLATAKAETHVVTGSLKNSGRKDSDYDENTWRGKIIFGGPSPGFPNDPVTYAKIEKNRGGPGSSHDFLRSAYLYQDRIKETIEDYLHDTV